MSINSVALRAEIANNPNNLTDAVTGQTLQQMAAVANDVGIAAALNLVRAGAPYSVFRNDVAPKEIIQAVAPADFSGAVALTVAKLQLILSIGAGGTATSSGTIDLTLANVRGSLAALFAAASQPTKDALLALASRQGSRAEVLFGTGAVVGVSDVGGAR